MQMTLETHKHAEYLKLAKTKYKEDWAVQTWLRIYEEGTGDIITKERNKKVKLGGIPPHSNFALQNLMKAIKLREEEKVMIHVGNKHI